MNYADSPTIGNNLCTAISPLPGMKFFSWPETAQVWCLWVSRRLRSLFEMD
jgi:hypothetical protein